MCRAGRSFSINRKISVVAMRIVLSTSVRFILHCCVGCVGFCSIAFGQQSSTNFGTAYLQLPVGARAVGLAGAYTAIANEPIALFYNPAGLAFFPNRPANFFNGITARIRSRSFRFCVWTKH